VPDRAPDLVHQSITRPDQALIYRLNGDRNPLHADPEAAKRAGFPRPILHGLCSYGVACHALLAAVCDYDATRIRSFDVRFTSPVFPGETLATEIWIDGDVASFRCTVPERRVIAINNGRAQLA
jgi:acyl dehydratase